MQEFKNIIIAIVFAFAASATVCAQNIIDTITAEDERIEVKVTEVTKTTTGTLPVNYEQFEKLNDKQIAMLLKENDPENYAIFHLGEMKKNTGKNFFVPGIVFTGVGVLLIFGGYVAVPMFSLITWQFDFFNRWCNNIAPWFGKIGLSTIAMGQPFLIASIVLRVQGGNLKKQAKNNYENRSFKDNTTSLNFNLYPNGFGVILKF